VQPTCCILLQVQQQQPGTFTYQEHFNRVGGAMLMPAVASCLYWVLLLTLRAGDNQDAKKLNALLTAKRSMIKELKVLASAGNRKNSSTVNVPLHPSRRRQSVACIASMAVDYSTCNAKQRATCNTQFTLLSGFAGDVSL